MKRKSILACTLVIVLAECLSLVGCGRTYTDNTNNATENSGLRNNAVTGPNTTNDMDENTNLQDDIRNSVNSARDNFEAAGENVTYTAGNLKDEFTQAGYQLKDSTDTKKDYFTGNETDYLAGNDVIRVYEYNSSNDLEADIQRISKNGLSVNGTDANYTRSPNYYRKGNSLIVYEGNEPDYTDRLGTLYGNTLIP